MKKMKNDEDDEEDQGCTVEEVVDEEPVEEQKESV